MAEMSLERACEILTARRYRKAAWRVSFDIGTGDPLYAYVADNSMVMLDADLAIAMAEKLERDAAPPADAGEGDAGLARTIKDIRAALGDRRPDDATMKVCPYGGGSGRETVYPLAGELRALLAAAERGGGPGLATRKAMELLKGSPFSGYAWELRRVMAVDLESGDTALAPEHAEIIAAALRECGMTEAPR